MLQSLFQLLLSGSGTYSGEGIFFNYAFDEYNFSIISNLFDNNSSYALYWYTEIENVRKNCIISEFVKTSKLRAKTSNTICLKTCSRSTKMAIIECGFSGRACPRNPLKPLLSSFCFKPIQPENLRSKMSNFGAFLLKKFWLRS